MKSESLADLDPVERGRRARRNGASPGRALLLPGAGGFVGPSDRSRTAGGTRDHRHAKRVAERAHRVRSAVQDGQGIAGTIGDEEPTGHETQRVRIATGRKDSHNAEGRE